ncbi:MAG: helix-turn-helix domain-containing protein [Candidatus Bathyarchaeia archaeon]
MQPPTSAGALCKETGIPDFKIYYALDELHKKGMVAVQYGKPKLYRALRSREAMGNLKHQLSDEHQKRWSWRTAWP